MQNSKFFIKVILLVALAVSFAFPVKDFLGREYQKHAAYNRLNELIKRDFSQVLSETLLGSRLDHDIYLAARTLEGEYFFAKIKRAMLADGNFEGGVVFELPNGELYEAKINGSIPEVVLKNGETSSAQVIEKALTVLSLPSGELVPVKLSTAEIMNSRLQNTFAGVFVNSGNPLAGFLANGVVEKGYVAGISKHVPQITRAFGAILSGSQNGSENVLGTSSEVLAASVIKIGEVDIEVNENFGKGTFTISGLTEASIAPNEIFSSQGVTNVEIPVSEAQQFIAVIAEGEVTTVEIEDLTILSEDIANDTLISEKIKNGTILNIDIADGAINSAKIENNTVHSDDILDNTLTVSDLAGTLAFAAGDFLDLAAIVHNNGALQGLRLPNASSDSPSPPSSGEGYIAWDTSGNQLIVYDGSSWSAVTGGGGGGGSLTAQEGDTTVDTTVDTLDFLAVDFTLSESPEDEVNISIDYTNSGITRDDQDETITGDWTFQSGITLDYSSPTLTIRNGETFGISDGTNTLLSLADSGTSAVLTVSGGLTVSAGSVNLPAGSIANSALANSSVTVTAGTGLSGGGTATLGGGAVTLNSTLGTSVSNSELVDDTLDFDKIANSLTLDEATSITASSALGLTIGNNVTLSTTGTGAITATDLSCTDCIGATEVSVLTLGTDTNGDYVASFTAGAGLTGSGSGEGSTPTIAIGAGTGITVNADSIETTLGTAIDTSEITDNTITFSDISNTMTLDAETTISAGSALSLLIGNNVTLTTNGTGAITATDLSCTNCIGATEISDLTLGTDTTGNYVATLTAGSGVSGSSSTEGGTPTIALSALTENWSQTGAFDIVLNNASSELQILESSGGAFYGTLDVGDLAADATYTFSGTSGTVLTSANYTGTLDSVYVNVGESPAAGDISGSFSGGLTISSNAVALGDDTTGNYIDNLTAGNNAISIGGSAGEGWEPAVSLSLQSSANALSSTTSSGSGLEITSGGLTLLQGCADGQILEWDEDTDVWACGDDTTGGGANTFETVDTPAGSDPVADSATDTLTLTATGTNLTITGTAGSDTIDFDISESALAGSGLAANGSALDVSVGNGLEISSDAVRVNQDFDFALTGNLSFAPASTDDLTITLDSDSLLALNQSFTGTTTANGITYTLTNSSSSGTQNGLYIDNAASSGTTEALLVLDNSDTDTAVTSAIQFVDAGGGFTNLFLVGATAISSSEFTILDSGITYNELTNSGTLTVTTVDINGGTIDGTAIGSSSASSGAFTTLSSTGVTTIGNDSATVAIDSSDWNITSTGAITGVSIDATGTGNSITNVTAIDLSCTNCIGGTEIDESSLVLASTNLTDTANIAYLNASNAFTASGQSVTATVAATGQLIDLNLTLGDDADTDTISALNVDVTSATTGDADTVYGLNVGNLGSANGTVLEHAIRIGSGWDNAFDINGTLISASEFTLLDSGIALSELTDSGTLTATTVDINGGNIDGTTIGASSAAAGTFTTLTATGAIAANGDSITSDGATLTINAGGTVDIQDGLTVDSITVDTGNLAVSTGTIDGALTLSGSTGDNLLQITLTNNTSSGTQNVAYLDNAAGSGSTESILVIDNSDTDTAVTNAIQFVIGGGTGFTNLFDVNGTLISVSEFTILDGGITLGTETDGNYVDNVTGGDGITVSGSAAEGWEPDITIDLDTTAADGSTTSSVSGLEFDGNGELTLIRGCAAGGILEWDNTNFEWDCGTDDTGGGGANSFETINAPAGTDPVAESATDTLTLAVTGTNLTITGDSGADSITFDIAESTLAGDGLTANGNALDVNEDFDFALTGNVSFTPASTDDLDINLDSDSLLTIDQAFSGTTTANSTTLTITNSSSSGTQNGLYIDNAASSGATEALLVIDNSDTDTAVTSGIQFVDAGGGFTNLFLIGSTSISPSEFTILDSGIALSELTDSGTLTATTVDINGGAIDGTTLGASSAAAGTFTQATITTGALAVNSESITFDGATLTINGGGAVDIQDGLTVDSATIDNGNLAVSTGTIDGALTLSGSTSDNLLQITLTNSSSSGTQNIAYFDNAASPGTTEAILVLDNSDTDTAVTSALQFIDAGGGFTNLFLVGSTAISSSEFAILDSGINYGELTNSGTLTVTTVDINGGAIDGTAIGAASASTAIFTTLEVTGNVDMNDAGADTITIGDANDQVAIVGDDWSITADGVLTVASCTGCGGGGANWDTIGDPSADGAIAFGSTNQTLDWTDSNDNASYFAFNFDNAGSSAGNDYFVEINNAVSTNSANDLNTEALLRLQQLDTTTSGTTTVDNFIYIDVAANAGATDGIEITNSGGNLTNAINIVDTSGGTIATAIVFSGTFTNIFDIGGTTLSGSEITILDSGINYGELTNSGTLTVTTVDINGGAIDGTTIGASAAAAGTFTTVTASGAIAANGGITFDAATDTVGAFTAAGTIDMGSNVVLNIGAGGTDFSGTGGLTLADALTVSSGGVGVTAGGVTIASGALAVNSDSITSDGALVINANDSVVLGGGGNTFTFDESSGPVYAGTARPAKKITLSPEYGGAVLTAFYGAGTDTNLTGTMTSDADTTQGTTIRNYYNWESSQTSAQHFYTVAVRITLPADFSAWATTNAIQVSYITESATTTQSDVDVRVYNENSATIVASDLDNSSTSWTTVDIDDSVLDDGTDSEWDAAGETAVIYLRLGSQDGDYARVGDIVLNYLGAF